VAHYKHQSKGQRWRGQILRTRSQERWARRATQLSNRTHHDGSARQFVWACLEPKWNEKHTRTMDPKVAQRLILGEENGEKTHRCNYRTLGEKTNNQYSMPRVLRPKPVAEWSAECWKVGDWTQSAVCTVNQPRSTLRQLSGKQPRWWARRWPRLCPCWSSVRVLTSPITTSGKVIALPRRVRTLTCSSWLRCGSWRTGMNKDWSSFQQLYRFLARRTDSSFNKVTTGYWARIKISNLSFLGHTPPPLPL